MLYGDIKQGGWGNKTDPLNYLGHPVPLLWGEFGKQDSYLLEGAPWVGRGIMHPRVPNPIIQASLSLRTLLYQQSRLKEFPLLLRFSVEKNDVRV